MISLSNIIVILALKILFANFKSISICCAPCRQLLEIREHMTFQREWHKMEASLNFLFCWRGIIDEDNTDWLINFLHLCKAHIQEGVTFENLNNLEFSTPNAEHTSKKKLVYEFPPNYQIENFNDIMDVIMVLWREGRGPTER